MTSDADRWLAWAARWETLQDDYVPGRAAQFDTALSYLMAITPRQPRILDLCCGPGSFAKAALRIPGATVIGVDRDAWLLEVARRTSDPARTNWLLKDLAIREWSDTLSGPSTQPR